MDHPFRADWPGQSFFKAWQFLILFQNSSFNPAEPHQANGPRKSSSTHGRQFGHGERPFDQPALNGETRYTNMPRVRGYSSGPRVSPNGKMLLAACRTDQAPIRNETIAAPERPASSTGDDRHPALDGQRGQLKSLEARGDPSTPMKNRAGSSRIDTRFFHRA